MVNPDRALTVSIAVLGFTSVVTQIVLLREFLSVLSGNELMIGILLGAWMLLTGAGAFAGATILRQIRGSVAIMLLMGLIALLPALTVFCLRMFRNILFPIGGLIGIIPALTWSSILLLPYCVTAGALFTALAGEISGSAGSNRIALAYGVEAIGSLLGGVVLTTLTLVYLRTFEVLLILQLVGWGTFILLGRRYSSRVTQVLGGILAVAAVGAFILLEPDRITKQHLFPGQDLLAFAGTPYGELTVTREGGQVNFYENGTLLRSTGDVTQDEEAVHYALVQHSHPRKVLVISGDIAGLAKELVKYGLDAIDYVEINPRLIDEVKAYEPWPSSAPVHPIVEDARQYVRSTAERYDVVLVGVPEPATAQLNRFYTLEFFEDLRQVLKPGAVISMRGPPAAEYYSADARMISSVLCNTLRKTFAEVLVIPGLDNYVLASDSALHTDVARRIEERGIPTDYVNRYYIDDTLVSRRSSMMMADLDSAAGTNRDFHPTSYYRQLRYWLDYFSVNEAVFGILIAVLLAVILARSDAVGLGMITGGFAASSLQVLLLISFQVIYGSVYQQIAFLITFFMGGLAAGSLLPRRSAAMRMFVLLQLALVVYALLLPLGLEALRGLGVHAALVQGSFYCLSVLLGLITGLEFSVASEIRTGSIIRVASGLYSSDLLGSAVGAIVVAAYLIPAAGITSACWITGAPVLLSAVVAFRARR